MKRKYEVFLWLLVLLKIILPYLLQSPVYEPHRDEFLYLAEGNHLDWGFMEVPPLLSVFSWFTHLFGDGIFWIKLWPSLFGAATFYVMGRLVIILGGKHFALVLLFFSFLFTAYLRVFFLFMPNAPEIFFWTLIAFSFIRYVQTSNNYWLYLFGISAGLGMLSKYSVLFYVVSVLVALLFSPYRNVFLNKHFWMACGIGLLIFLPNFLWQYHHHFPVVFHMNELQKTQLQYIHPSDFLKDQLVMFLPCAFVWMCGLYNVFRGSNRHFRFIGWAYIFVLILLLAGHGKGYYSLGTYPPLFAFGAYYLERYTAEKRKVLRVVFIAVPLLLGFSFLPLALPIFPPQKLAAFYKNTGVANTGLLRWEDLKNHALPQDFSDMLGWKEMAQKVAKTYHSLTPAEQKNTLIFCNNYGMAAAVNYYGKEWNLPQAYSDNASFLYWLPQNKYISNLILVCADPDELKNNYIKNFTEAYFTDSVTTPYAREFGDRILLGKGANNAFRTFFRDKIRKDKEELGDVETGKEN